jgi:hypothetical protein
MRWKVKTRRVGTERDAFVAAHQDLIRRVDEDANPPRSDPKDDTATHV